MYGASKDDGSTQNDGMLGSEKISHYIPLCIKILTPRKTSTTTRGEVTLEIDFIRTPEERAAVMNLMNDVIVDGTSWPFEHPFETDSDFAAYFLSHTALCARVVHPDGTTEIAGAFYVKPNFPGRCSDFCNGGFIVEKVWRGCGVGSRMGEAFLRVARDLGYRAAYFNLVFVCNTYSMRLWEKLGFTALARIPKVARLKGVEGFTDAIQYYKELIP